MRRQSTCKGRALGCCLDAWQGCKGVSSLRLLDENPSQLRWRKVSGLGLRSLKMEKMGRAKTRILVEERRLDVKKTRSQSLGKDAVPASRWCIPKGMSEGNRRLRRLSLMWLCGLKEIKEATRCEISTRRGGEDVASLLADVLVLLLPLQQAPSLRLRPLPVVAPQ